MSKDSASDNNLAYKGVIYAGAIFAIAAWLGALGFYVMNFSGGLSFNQEVWGQFGDFIGGTLNPVFAFCSFLALLYTIHLQRRELSESRQVLKDQEKQMSIQTFETTFVSFLSLSNKNLNSIILKSKDKKDSIAGYDALVRICQNLRTAYKGQVARSQDNSDAEVLVREAYSRFYVKNKDEISQYLRFFNQLLLFVNGCQLEEKKRYWNLIRDQLKTEEVILLFYHSWTNDDFIDITTLVNNDFFKYLSHEDLFDKELHANILLKGNK